MAFNSNRLIRELQERQYCLCCIGDSVARELPEFDGRQDDAETIGKNIGKYVSLDDVLRIEADLAIENGESSQWRHMRRGEIASFTQGLIEGRLSTTDNLVIDYSALCKLDKDTVLGIVRSTRQALEELIGYQGIVLDAPIGKELFDRLYVQPERAFENYEAVNVIVAGVKAGMFTNYQRWADRVVSAEQNRNQDGRSRAAHHEAIIARRATNFLRYMEDQFARLEVDESVGEGLQIVQSKFAYELDKLYLDGKYLGMFSNVTADQRNSVSSAGAAWFTEEKIDVDVVTGEQWRIILWAYRAGDDSPKELTREAFWTRNARYESLAPPQVDDAGKVTARINTIPSGGESRGTKEWVYSIYETELSQGGE